MYITEINPACKLQDWAWKAFRGEVADQETFKAVKLMSASQQIVLDYLTYQPACRLWP